MSANEVQEEFKPCEIFLRVNTDMQNFYWEMESDYSSYSITGRKCVCLLRKAASRSCIYLLSDKERERLSKDICVLSIKIV